MSEQPRDEEYGPVGAPEEDLRGAPGYGDVTPADAEPGPATPQAEPLPGEGREAPFSSPATGDEDEL